MRIKECDKLPNSELFYIDQLNEVKKIRASNLCKDGKTIILGMPGAFTKTCSALHLPGFIKNYDLQHLSLYQLTIEEGTKFFTDYKKGLINIIDNDKAASFYKISNEILNKYKFSSLLIN